MSNLSYIIFFAGPPGASKTPIAMHLSCALNLPVFEHDAIRMEVREDLLINSSADPTVVKEVQKRTDERYKSLLARKISFVYDASVDRTWQGAQSAQALQEAGYEHFIISLDLSKVFIQKLHAANLSASASRLDKYYAQHQAFLQQHAGDVGISVTDANFANRLQVCEAAVRAFITKEVAGD